MRDEIMKIPSNTSLFYVFGGLLLLVLTYFAAVILLRRLGKDPQNLLPPDTMKKVSLPLIFILFSFLLRMGSLRELLGLDDYGYIFRKSSTLLFIFSFTWLLIKVIKLVKQLVIQNYDVSSTDNLKARKVYTQFTILERIFIFIITIMALGIALMSFEEIREIGISIFASAGVAGIIIGFSAQKMIGAILAGIQIALAQPIKIDDVVVVEGEWGRIEQITLTYVVVAIWDKRRLVLPTTYFIEKPFQNWTKTTADILGTVFLYTDYRLPIEPLREELGRILKNTDLWDGQTQNIQVTNATGTHVEIRALMSAKDSPTAWDLRVHVREKLIAFLQENYPNCLPHTRVFINDEFSKQEK
ncbi:Small-conductance mechanosensitive channel [Muriicola jejuensis]|uniref:Mechanosensitive ion channel n=2 Tax=Muriicola jejuensis TaxID=504488 RepID=A0A6P0UDL2_9FLAO|nr:mechanosensitive ion channel domain-containing protein [Muriicola jejuensis]NER09798.1 mechanosensitive ion channel [Muriicola jejuensis]SMP05658.1 Small-conductance mechanosensitive channel [Muriicola jejuensis]